LNTVKATTRCRDGLILPSRATDGAMSSGRTSSVISPSRQSHQARAGSARRHRKCGRRPDADCRGGCGARVAEPVRYSGFLSMANSQILAQTDRPGQSGRGGTMPRPTGTGRADANHSVIMNSPPTRTLRRDATARPTAAVLVSACAQ
jgi:hypothetical protein